jgi:small GTP-binding protein
MNKLKTILVGESQVGKTSIITQYIRQSFDEEYLPTISADKSIKDLIIEKQPLTLEIWDTAGQEIYRNVNKIFMKNAKIALLVYDITNKESFDSLDSWYNQICENNDKENIIIGVVGNKSDLYEERVIEENEGQNYAVRINGIWGETSAMDFDSVNSFFEKLAIAYLNKEKQKQKTTSNEKIKEDNNNTVKIEKENHVDNNKKKEKGGCC